MTRPDHFPDYLLQNLAQPESKRKNRRAKELRFFSPLWHGDIYVLTLMIIFYTLSVTDQNNYLLHARLLIDNPLQRLGATGAGEVKYSLYNIVHHNLENSS